MNEVSSLLTSRLIPHYIEIKLGLRRRLCLDTDVWSVMQSAAPGHWRLLQGPELKVAPGAPQGRDWVILTLRVVRRASNPDLEGYLATDDFDLEWVIKRVRVERREGGGILEHHARESSEKLVSRGSNKLRDATWFTAHSIWFWIRNTLSKVKYW